MAVKKVPATNRGDCEGCVFYRPERPRHVFGMEQTRRWCTHGSYHAPDECFTEQIIYKEVSS